VSTSLASDRVTREQRASVERRFLLCLSPILAIALAIRVAFVLIRQSSVQLVTGDAYWYHFQAKLVAQGRGFLHPFDFYKDGIVSQGADHPPGFVLVLTVLDWLGIDSAQGQRLAMCLVGTVSVAVIGYLGRHLAGSTAGLIAASLAAVYPNMWINDGMLMVETVFILATAVSLLACYRYLSRPNRLDVALLSVALTVAAMTRPEAILLFLVLPVPLVLARRNIDLQERAFQLVIAACIPILAFAPWVLYNQSRFEDSVLLSTGAGQTLAAGNCDLTFNGTNLGFYDTKCLLAPQIVEPTTEDRSLRDSEYREIARAYISEHSSELPKVMAARVGRVWHLYRVDQSIGLDGFVEGRAGGAPGGGFFLVREALWAYFVLAPLAIFGLYVLHRRRTKIYPLLMQPALVTIVAALTFGITRYRAGAEVTIVVCAAVAINVIAAKLFPPRNDQVEPFAAAEQEVSA
jgi:4-amino-4-deoxy-L-arabinose transferase-like glycosyltransferase